MTPKEKKTRKQIVDLLKSKNLYEISDEILIDELLFLQNMIAESKKSIETHGVLINVRALPDLPPVWQLNQATGLYRDSLKSLITICTKLGITPQERSKLKLVDKKSIFDIQGFLNN